MCNDLRVCGIELGGSFDDEIVICLFLLDGTYARKSLNLNSMKLLLVLMFVRCFFATQIVFLVLIYLSMTPGLDPLWMTILSSTSWLLR